MLAVYQNLSQLSTSLVRLYQYLCCGDWKKYALSSSLKPHLYLYQIFYNLSIKIILQIFRDNPGEIKLSCDIITKMANHQELRDISKARLRTAKILLDNSDFDGAIYMMGYVLECALKAIICKRLNLPSYPDKGGSKDIENIFKTHKFDILLTLSGMENDFSLKSPKRRYENWSELTKWSTDIRYEPVGTRTRAEAERMYNALVGKPHGIITWIKRHRKW